MKDTNDHQTVDFLAPARRHGGGRKRVYESNAARVAAYRARKNKRTLSALVSPDLVARLDAFMLARDETKSDVVERALRDFFRKR